MARPRKYRRVCCFPQALGFVPVGMETSQPGVTLTVDEYEAIRLIDLEGLTQEEAAEQMQVGRSTVQAIYNSARHKLALCLVGGRPLIITGGDYEVCPRQRPCGGCRHGGGCPGR